MRLDSKPALAPKVTVSNESAGNHRNRVWAGTKGGVQEALANNAIRVFAP